MASRRGIAASACILAAITAASFAVWAVPQGRDATFVVSEFGPHLDGVAGVHSAIAADLEEGLAGLLDGTVSPAEYAGMAEASASQVRSQVVLLVESDPPAEWRESYAAYAGALRQYDAYVRETVAIAGMVGSGAGAEAVGGALEAAAGLREAAEGLAAASEAARP